MRPRTYATGYVDGWLSVLNDPVPSIPRPDIEQGEDEYVAGFGDGQIEALSRQATNAVPPARGEASCRHLSQTRWTFAQTPEWQNVERDDARRRLASEELKRHVEPREPKDPGD